MTQVDRAIAALPRWRKLLDELVRRGGSETTGVLGHVYGIGQNVRGIRYETNAHLGDEARILSLPTPGKSWATFQYMTARDVLAMSKPDARDLYAVCNDGDKEWLAARRPGISVGGYAPDHERVSLGTPSESPDTLAGDPSRDGGPVTSAADSSQDVTHGVRGSRGRTGRPSSPSPWQKRVGVSGATRRADEGRLF